MILYIYLLWHQIVIYCAEASGCLQTSEFHFNQLLALGSLELLFELPQIVKIYVHKKDKSGDEK